MGEAGSDGKPDINAYSEAGKALAEHLETRDQRVKEEADKIAGVEFEKRWDKTSRFKCQLAQTILRDEGKLEKYAFIKTPLAFSNLYDSVYELTRKMGKLIEKHPEKYDENKKLISSLMDEAVKCVQVESDYGLKCAVWESILYGTEIIEDGGDLKEINVKANDDKTIGRKYAADSDKMNLCNDMLNSISEAICYVLGGEVPLEAGCRILKEKGYEVPEFKGKVDEAKKSARRYLDLPEEKKEVFDDLFKAMKLNGDSPLLRSEPLRSIHLAIRVGQPMYNEQIMLFVKDCLRLEQLNGKLKENKATDEEKKEAEGLPERIKTEKTDILALMIETVKGLDMPWITEGYPNTLIAHQEELLEASYAAQLVKELGKEKDGDITLLDSLLGKSELKDPENGTYPDEVIRKTMSRIYFDSKMEQIRGGVMKARGAAMLHLYALDTLDETYVIPKSQRKYAGPVSDSTAFSLAKDLYTQGAAKVKTETKNLFKNPLFLRDAQIGTGAAKIIESRVENDQTKRLIDIYTATSEESKKRKTDNQTLIREQYDLLGKKIEEIDRQLADETIGEEKRKELEEDRKKTVTDMEDLQIVYGLSCKRFGSATRKMSIKELFRSLPIMDACGSFKGMTDEQRREVLLDLTAGAFLTKEADEKELKLADMRNMAGVRMYLTYAANRYERLIDKYGKGKPDMLYVMEHKDEILCDVSMAQEDSELLKGYKDAFDLKQTKDMRTCYLIEYGTALCWSLSLLINMVRPQVMSASGGKTYEEAVEEAWRAEKEKRKTFEELKEKQGVLKNGYIFERGELKPQATRIFQDAAARALEKVGAVH